jgi:hypothetical protein
MEKTINNGDVYDIGQTVNGISKFIMLSGKWHYYNKDMSREYEYSQDDLTIAVLDKEDYYNTTFVGNIFELLSC